MTWPKSRAAWSRFTKTDCGNVCFGLDTWRAHVALSLMTVTINNRIFVAHRSCLFCWESFGILSVLIIHFDVSMPLVSREDAFNGLFIWSLFLAVKSSCLGEFLKCEHYCHEPPNGEAECHCREGYTLQSDGASCAGKPLDITCAHAHFEPSSVCIFPFWNTTAVLRATEKEEPE